MDSSESPPVNKFVAKNEKFGGAHFVQCSAYPCTLKIKKSNVKSLWPHLLSRKLWMTFLSLPTAEEERKERMKDEERENKACGGHSIASGGNPMKKLQAFIFYKLVNKLPSLDRKKLAYL